MFTLRFTNVTCASDGATFETADQAVAAGRAAGFEFSVWQGATLVASWTVFGGLRRGGC